VALGRFNGFLKSVFLRVSEARDLGEYDRVVFYEHMKAPRSAAPTSRRFTGDQSDPKCVIALSDGTLFTCLAGRQRRWNSSQLIEVNRPSMLRRGNFGMQF
jgi:hypothetical protein